MVTYKEVLSSETMIFLWLSQLAFAEPCRDPISLKDLRTSLSMWESGIISQDMDKVKTGEEKTRALLPCLTEKISPRTAFQFHLLQGVMFWLAQKQFSSEQSFSAAKFAYSSGRLSNKLFPSGHAIHDLFQKAPKVVLSDKLPLLAENKFYFDGHKKTQRPMNAPTIFQMISKEALFQTYYLKPEDNLPEIKNSQDQTASNTKELPTSQNEIKTPPLPSNNKLKLRKPFIYTAVGLAVVSTLFYAKAGVIKSNYKTIADNGPTGDDVQILDELYKENQFYSRGVWIGSGLSITFGLSAFLFQ